jgi:hypothetical protein
MKINYHCRIFKAQSNSPNGQVDDTVRFYYFQERNMLHGHYQGGAIVYGQLIGKIDASSNIQMHYHHIDVDGKFRTGICHSVPSLTEGGKIRLHESWQWTNGDKSKGQSILIETNE